MSCEKRPDGVQGVNHVENRKVRTAGTKFLRLRSSANQGQ